MDNMKLYNELREVPKEATKPIAAGRLKGMTNINPQWRLKKLTEAFGPCGIGWYTEIVKEWTEPATTGEIVTNIIINLYVKQDGEWSKPIVGVGGSKIATKETGGIYVNDEGYKMAYTDAISVACKALGMAADIYYANDRTKYDLPVEDKPKKKNDFSEVEFVDGVCESCGKDIRNKGNWSASDIVTYSKRRFQGKVLCPDCQKAAMKEEKW